MRSWVLLGVVSSLSRSGMGGLLVEGGLGGLGGSLALAALQLRRPSLSVLRGGSSMLLVSFLEICSVVSTLVAGFSSLFSSAVGSTVVSLVDCDSLRTLSMFSLVCCSTGLLEPVLAWSCSKMSWASSSAPRSSREARFNCSIGICKKARKYYV